MRIEYAVLQKAPEQITEAYPELTFGEVRFHADRSKIELTGTVTDDIGLKQYTLTCQDKEGREITAGEGREQVAKTSVLGWIGTEGLESGEYVVEFTAEDLSGNTTALYIKPFGKVR